MNVTPDQQRLRATEGGVSAGIPPAATEPGPPPPARRLRAYAIGACAVALLAAYLGSGFYIVGADERAVVRRFGAVAEHVGPGMHYRLPWPVDRADVLKTTSVMQTGVGFILERASGSAPATGMELLTGDTNILGVALVVQYVIRNPADFLFQVENPQRLVGTLAQSVPVSSTPLTLPTIFSASFSAVPLLF